MATINNDGGIIFYSENSQTRNGGIKSKSAIGIPEGHGERHPGDAVMDAVNNCNIGPAHIVGVLLAICAALLVLPHTGEFMRGFGKVASITLWGAGIGTGVIVAMVGGFWLCRVFYGAWWTHRKKSVEFEAFRARKQAETAAYVATTTAAGNLPQIRYQPALGRIGHVQEAEILSIERK